MGTAVVLAVFLSFASALPQDPGLTPQHECGRVAEEEGSLSNESALKLGQLPWHANIYLKTVEPYSMICGGSLVTTTAVISAAHCFWREGERARPAEEYAVALGKADRQWNVDDHQAHFSNVTKIFIASLFTGQSTNYASDIAVVKLQSEAIYSNNIRPVCIDFNAVFDRSQLRSGKMGKIVRWGNGAASLHMSEWPFVPFDQCYEDFPSEHSEYLTSDKICGGDMSGSTLCYMGGTGFVFPDVATGIKRYYLRGVASVKSSSEGEECFGPVLFTKIIHHQNFLKRHIAF